LRLRAGLALLLCLGGCGGGDEEAAELVAYVNNLQRFQPYNQLVEGYIAFFEAPGRPVTQAEVDAARQLIDEYARAVGRIDSLSFKGEGLRIAHRFYVLSCEDARQLAADSTGDAQKEARTVAFGLRALRAYITGRLYPGLEVMLAYRNLDLGDSALAWPE